jgi:hypothetical protein
VHDRELARLAQACEAAAGAAEPEQELRLLKAAVRLAIELEPRLALTYLARQADIHASRNEVEQHLSCCEQRHALARHATGSDSAETVGALSQLASTYFALGRVDAADRCLEGAVNGLRGAVELHVALLEFQARLSALKADRGRSLQLRERVLQMRSALNDGSPDRARLLAMAQSELDEAGRLERSGE